MCAMAWQVEWRVEESEKSLGYFLRLGSGPGNYKMMPRMG